MIYHCIFLHEYIIYGKTVSQASIRLESHNGNTIGSSMSLFLPIRTNIFYSHNSNAHQMQWFSLFSKKSGRSYFTNVECFLLCASCILHLLHSFILFIYHKFSVKDVCDAALWINTVYLLLICQEEKIDTVSATLSFEILSNTLVNSALQYFCTNFSFNWLITQMLILVL